ncbi:MAG: hypothetical protein COT18_06860 [Elusimicrobia bacterium CG08_land_8_20_14_0_20_59_10]|nr:MAG: hypothetical protein COT18_06860 [Elusimicrobia bacterium CG08_land_8_20_14_0_20_59_10]
MTPLIPLGALPAGIVMLVAGLIKRGSANAFKSIPCSPIAGLKGGERLFITGKATAPVHTRAPVSGDSCVFYTEAVDRTYRRHQIGSSLNERHTERVNTRAYGGFFVRDGSGTALVVPHYDVLDLTKPATVKDDSLSDMSGSTRRTERLILEGDAVTVLGTPRNLGDFMRYLRANSGLDMPAPFVEQLLKMEKEEAGASLQCFFGQGVERVSDVEHTAYVAGTANSAAFLLKLGAILAASGLAFLLYILKSAAPSQDF